MKDCRFTMNITATDAEELNNFLNILFDDVKISVNNYPKEDYRYQIAMGDETLYFNEEKYLTGYEITNSTIEGLEAKVEGTCDFSVSNCFLSDSASNYAILKAKNDAWSPYITCLEEQSKEKNLKIHITAENAIYGIDERYLIKNGEIEFRDKEVNDIYNFPVIFPEIEENNHGNNYQIA